MKKNFCKKMLSAFLAAVMVLAIIPVGMISAVAEGYTVDEGTKTVVITTAAGWNEVANNEAYAAYNFVLGSNIDFNETEVDKPLFSTVPFAGTFDGGVYTISNFEAGTKDARVDYQGIIASTTVESSISDSKIDTDSYIEIKNVTLVNAKFYSSANCGGLVGDLKAYARFENIKIENITVDGSASNGWVGGMVGYMQPTALISAINCNVTGTISSKREAGGVLARLADAACSYNNATNIFRNCYVDATISTNNSSGRIGGIIGAWGRSNSNGVGALLIENCYAAGVYKNNGNAASRTAGIVGAWRKSTATIKNVVINVAELECAVCSYGDQNGKEMLTLNNIYYASENAGNNGKEIFQNAILYTEGTADKKIESAVALSLVSKGTDGFINGVAGSIGDAKYAQTTGNAGLAAGDTYIIRFVAPMLKSIDENSATMTIVVKSGDTVVKTFTKSACTMYTELAGHKNGITETYTAGEGQYADVVAFAAVAIMDVPVGAEYSYEVSLDFSIGGVQINGATFGATASSVGVLS